MEDIQDILHTRCEYCDSAGWNQLQLLFVFCSLLLTTSAGVPQRMDRHSKEGDDCGVLRIWL